MIVAEIVIMSGNSFSGNVITHIIKFANMIRADLEFKRVSAFLKERGDRKNDLPKIIEMTGDGNQVSVPLDEIRSIGLCDYAIADQQAAGVRDAYPNLFKV